MAKAKKTKVLYVMSDTETSTTPLNSNTNLETYVWLTGFKVAGLYDKVSKTFDSSYKTELKYYYGKDSIKELLDGLFNLACECNKNNIDVVVFFHNAKYDFSYIQYYILNECGLYNTKSTNYSIGKSCIDSKGVFYSSTISKRSTKRVNGKKTEKTVNFKILDMYKIFPSKLADIGNSVGIKKLSEIFDYDRIIPFDYIPTENDLKYFEHDIEIMCKAYAQAPKFFYEKSTIGGITKSYYKEKFLSKITEHETDLFPVNEECNQYFYNKEFKNCKEYIFDNSENIKDIYKYLCDYAYKGGMTIANAKYVGKTVYNNSLPNNLIPIGNRLKIKDNIYHLDVNSLYPSCMENEVFPVGVPEIIHNNGLDNFEEYLIKQEKENNKKVIIDVYIYEGKVKANKMPCFLIGKDGRKKAKHLKYKAFYEEIEDVKEVMTLEEFEYLKNNHYNMNYEILTGYIFKTKKGLFTEFIGVLKAKKIEYNNDKFLRNCYKLLMNNAYGKFGEKAEKENMQRLLDENGNWYTNAKDEEHEKGNIITETTGQYFYPPIAIYVTSYARLKMMKYINKVNWKNVIYMDTDSIHLIGEKNYNKLFKADCIHDTKLGLLKLEEICLGEKVLAPKKYAYYDSDNNFKVKCAGLPKEAQEEIKSFNQFEYGLTFVPKGQKNIADIKTDNIIHIGKLQQKLVRGGIKLSETIFTIKEPDFNKSNGITIEFDSISKIPIQYI